MTDTYPIGIFDSGVGGISVYRKIRERLPKEDIIYFADQYNLPYGSKDLSYILKLAIGITEFLLGKGCRVIVVACNTACAAALHELRKIFPATIFVGMEPAVKPAASMTKSGAVGVLATEGTFKGDPYAGVLKRFAKGVEVYEQPCAGLAEAIEADISSEVLVVMLEELIQPLKDKNIDQLALACTHYPLIIELIKKVAGDAIAVIDPADAIARRVQALLLENEMMNTTGGLVEFYTSASSNYKCSSLITNEFDSLRYCSWGDEVCLKEC